MRAFRPASYGIRPLPVALWTSELLAAHGYRSEGGQPMDRSVYPSRPHWHRCLRNICGGQDTLRSVEEKRDYAVVLTSRQLTTF